MANLRSIRKRLEEHRPHLEIASGDIASFSTDMIAGLNEIKVHFYPLQEGTGTPSPQNIRPLSGWSELDLLSRGKNLLKVSADNLKAGAYGTGYTATYTDSGVIFNITGTANSYWFLYAILNIKESMVGLRFTYSSTNQFASDAFVSCDANGGSRTTIPNGIIRTSDVGKILGLRIYPGDNKGIVSVQNIQVELGSTATAYEPYNGTKNSVLFPDTYYGGYVDLVSGRGVAEWLYDDLGNYRWDGASSASSTYIGNAMWISAFTGSANKPLLVADRFNTVSINTFNGSVGVDGYFISVSSNGILRLMTPQISGMTAAQVKAYVTGAKFAIKLDTPIEFTVDPLTLKTLRGVNNIWSNSNDIVEVKYWTH